jgi:hypothetical protein
MPQSSVRTAGSKGFVDSRPPLPGRLPAAPGKVNLLLQQDLESRIPTVRPITLLVIDAQIDIPDKTQAAIDSAFPIGSVTVTFGDAAFRDLLRTHLSSPKTIAKAAQVINKRKDTIDGRKSKPLSQAADELVALRMYGELRYDTKVLAQFLSVTTSKTLPAALLTFPYAGGNLVPDLFKLFVYEYPTGHPIAHDYPETVAIVRVPLLSDLEKEALSALPKSQSSLGIATAMGCYAITLVMIAIAAATGRQQLVPGLPGGELNIDATSLEKLGVAGTVAELVRARRAALSGIKSK